ncbi:CoA-binding protein [uncultured Polaribacter sp.]|uniref:CoA-binding protein n=1 Tax=uncultured Polaribacter sp. TaxID=174711 RepID=UPI00261A3B15|nr:CoA-binding protein [uncultured Polaribacter sp.]
MEKKTLVIGASLKAERYSNKAIKKLRENNIPVVAIGLKKGSVLDVNIDTTEVAYKNIDTVTLYLNPKRQKAYYNFIVNLKPKRVIFNPGTENLDFVNILQAHDIKAEVACTLVLLATKQY